MNFTVSAMIGDLIGHHPDHQVCIRQGHKPGAFNKCWIASLQTADHEVIREGSGKSLTGAVQRLWNRARTPIAAIADATINNLNSTERPLP